MRPDVYTLDAGWQNRRSIFEAKDALNLPELLDELHRVGSGLSLWVSHNGPMGIAPEYMEECGLPVGTGESAAYCGEGYGVLMSERFEELLTERFCTLAKMANHFKIDWDNDCASCDEFRELYPTRNHVREASINVMIRIAKKVREANPDIVLRNGWWPSPWWLLSVDQVFLSDSGDAEYAMLPALDQRNAAITGRDLMFYNSLRRDESMVPLDGFDCHEFAKALRNPFADEPGVWMDLLYTTFMRGNTYITLTLQPEALEDYQVEALRRMMEFTRNYAGELFVKECRMIGGAPGRGEIYGFLMSGAKRDFMLLRNPSVMAQRYKLTGKGYPLQVYPVCQVLIPDEELFMLPHDVRVVVWMPEEVKPLFNGVPFVATECAGKIECRFPAELTINERIRPLVSEVYQIPEFRFEMVKTEPGRRLCLMVRSPYRMQKLMLHIHITGTANLQIFNSRYDGASSSSGASPVTELRAGMPGYGENKNPDQQPQVSGRYFTTPVASGGEHFFALVFDRDPGKITVQATGYGAMSREVEICEGRPYGFEAGLPPMHPYGFPRVIELTDLEVSE